MTVVAAVGCAFGPMCLADPAGAEIVFSDVTASSGIRFELRNAPTAEKRMIETMAGGLAVFDFDGDRRPDIFFTNGASPDGFRKASPDFFNRLYRNEGDWRFTDVTQRARVAGRGYSMGAAAADYDNDGDVDLFVAGVFQSTLYRNEGDGTFADVTAQSGVESAEWAVAATWFDYDGDSLLDLFVVNYADWTPEFDRYCGDQARGFGSTATRSTWPRLRTGSTATSATKASGT